LLKKRPEKMTTNRIDHKGFVTTGPITSTVVTTAVSGPLNVAGPISQLPRYELYRSAGAQAITGDGVHFIMSFSGSQVRTQNGLSLWDEASNIFRPTTADIGKVFTFRVDAALSASNGSPNFHIDFEVSGTLDEGAYSIHKQSVDVHVIRGGGYDHSHLHAIFILLVDSQVAASGVQMYGSIDGSHIVTVTSRTLFIKEG